MGEVTVYCEANRDGRRSVSVSLGREDCFAWEYGTDPTPDEFDPRLDWSIDLRVRSDLSCEDGGAVGLWYRTHRTALADVARDAASQLPLGIANGVAGWGAEFARPWGTVRVVISTCDAVHARKAAEHLREFADTGLGPIALELVGVRDAVAPTDWLTRQSEV